MTYLIFHTKIFQTKSEVRKKNRWFCNRPLSPANIRKTDISILNDEQINSKNNHDTNVNILQNIVIVPPKINENPENTNIEVLPPVNSVNEEEVLCQSADHFGDHEVIL